MPDPPYQPPPLPAHCPLPTDSCVVPHCLQLPKTLRSSLHIARLLLFAAKHISDLFPQRCILPCGCVAGLIPVVFSHCFPLVCSCVCCLALLLHHCLVTYCFRHNGSPRSCQTASTFASLARSPALTDPAIFAQCPPVASSTRPSRRTAPPHPGLPRTPPADLGWQVSAHPACP